jgi:hypothetical protein
MTCPRLEWKGPTRAQYEEISLQGVQRTVANREEASGALTAEARQELEQEIEREVRSHIKETFTSLRAKLNKSDRKRIRHFKNGGALNNEELLLNQLDSITVGKFPLAALQRDNRLGIEELYIEIVADYYNQQPAYNAREQRLNTLDRTFRDQTSSQGRPTSQIQASQQISGPGEMMAIGDDHDDNDNDEEGIAGGAGDDNAGGSESPFSGTFAERMNEGLAELAIT